MKLPETKQAQIRAVIYVYAIAIIFWLTLVVWREVNQKDVKWMRQVYVEDVPVVDELNGWAIGHFLNYLVLGFLAPQLWPYIAAAGVAFELLEVPMGAVVSKYIDSKLIEDTIVNTTGLAIGVLLRHVYNDWGWGRH